MPLAELAGKTLAVGPLEQKDHLTVVGIFQVPDGDLVILDILSSVKGAPSLLVALLVRNSADLKVVSDEQFYSADNTPFRAERQEEDRLVFDLGFEEGKQKTGVYTGGKLVIRYTEAQQKSMAKSDCATLLNAVRDCAALKQCNKQSISFSISMAVQRHLTALENKPGFRADTFFDECKKTCMSRKYDLHRSLQRLCGY